MSKTAKWLLGILIVLILSGFGFFIGYYLPKKESEKAANIIMPTLTDDKTNSAAEEQAQNGASWHIYKNFTHSFLFEYPDGATVENASSSEGEKGKPATEAYCVKVSTKYVWMIVASRDIPDNVLCLKTGLGTEWSNAPDEQVTAAGPTYTAKGMKTEAASAGYYQDDYMITTASGDKIEYGIDVNEKYDTTMTKAQAKDLVHKMVASFSPAE